MHRRLLNSEFCVLYSAFCILSSVSCSHPRPPLPIYGRVADFALIAENGQPFSSDLLKGKIWVADFIFTSCTGPCPRMSSQMARVQRSTPAEVRLVSFTVDPDRDTPEALSVYSRRFQADPSRWSFLTGRQQALHTIKRETFKLGDVDGSLNHSTRFVLIDRAGQIRGYYDDVDEMLAGIQYLVNS